MSNDSVRVGFSEPSSNLPQIIKERWYQDYLKAGIPVISAPVINK